MSLAVMHWVKVISGIFMPAGMPGTPPISILYSHSPSLILPFMPAKGLSWARAGRRRGQAASGEA